jgi:mono/diheme cytochrome c family protein
MWPDRAGIVITAVIVVLLAGATVAVYSVDPVEGQAETAAAPDGETVFLTAGCTGCHSLGGVSNGGFIGPNLTGLPDRAGERVDGLSAEDYVRQSILDPWAYIVDEYGEVMPTLPLDTAEVDALVEFLLLER